MDPFSSRGSGGSEIITKANLQELVRQCSPNERLEPEVEDVLLEVADEFIESVTTFAATLAKHRNSDTLEVKDLALHLERNWDIRIPGFGVEDLRVPPRTHTISEPQKERTKRKRPD